MVDSGKPLVTQKVVTVVIDLAFLTVWIGIHQIAQRGFRWLGTLPGLNGVVAIAIEIVFNISILTVILAYLARDVALAVQRIWGRK